MGDESFNNQLHSHSGIEREMKFPKFIVLVDEKFGNLFNGEQIVPFLYKRKKYYKVSIKSFIRNGGVFKNFYD